MSSKQTKKFFGSNRNKLKQDLFRLCYGLFRETKNKKFQFVSVCFGVSNLCRNNWNKQNCFEINRNNPKFSEKYKICSLQLFRLVFCLFRFNQNIETLCFGIEAKQPKQTVLKQTKTNWNNPKFAEKIPKYALYQTVSVALLFVSVPSTHQNSFFLVWNRNNRNNYFVSDSAKTSFGSSFGCFKSKLVYIDTLDWITWMIRLDNLDLLGMNYLEGHARAGLASAGLAGADKSGLLGSDRPWITRICFYCWGWFFLVYGAGLPVVTGSLEIFGLEIWVVMTMHYPNCSDF